MREKHYTVPIADSKVFARLLPPEGDTKTRRTQQPYTHHIKSWKEPSGSFARYIHSTYSVYRVILKKVDSSFFCRIVTWAQIISLR